MNGTEFFNDPVSAVCRLEPDGRIDLHSLTWQKRQYTIVAQGRQWETEEGRHVLAEAADGTRFELELRRDNMAWYVRKVWRTRPVA